jgi:hypothetical protein
LPWDNFFDEFWIDWGELITLLTIDIKRCEEAVFLKIKVVNLLIDILKDLIGH